MNKQIVASSQSIVFLLIAVFLFPKAAACQDAASDYNQLIVKASSLFKEGSLDEARKDIRQAIKLNATNYLAYAVAAKIASKQGDSEEATNLVQKALELAPDEDKDKVRELAQRVQSAASSSAPAVSQTQTQPQPPASLSDEDQLRLDSLMLISDDMDKAATQEDKARYFREFLEKSSDFANAHPEQTNIWVMRAAAAVQLNFPGIGWVAGRHLRDLGMIHNEDKKVRNVMAELERNGWLDDPPPTVDWSDWSADRLKMAADCGDQLAQKKIADNLENNNQSAQTASSPDFASGFTALDLIRQGDKYVQVQSKDKVLQVYSDKSVGSMAPEVWHMIYYDPAVFSKTVELTFEAGVETALAHPTRPFELPANLDQVLDLSKVTVDSDRALEIAASQPLLKGLKLRYSKATLEGGKAGPEWRVELWSAKVSNPAANANVGTVYISATDGSIIRSNLHPGSAR